MRLIHLVKFWFQTVKNCELYLVLVSMLVLDLIILTTWQVVDPMYRDIEIFDLEPSPSMEQDIMLKPYLEHCHSNNNDIWLGMCILSGVSRLFLLLMTLT